MKPNITALALRIYSECRAIPAIERLKLHSSKVQDSDSRYISINRHCGNQGYIRVSSHGCPENEVYDLNLVVRNEAYVEKAFEIAKKWLKETYAPDFEVQATAA